jgi:chaperonin GroEL (HSP60 family)
MKSIHVDDPATKILIDISHTQDEEVVDETTTVAVFTG